LSKSKSKSKNRCGPCVVRENPGYRAICACGLSAYMPYCDGTHLGTGIEPLMVLVSEAKEVTWCGCGESEKFPLCDATACANPE